MDKTCTRCGATKPATEYRLAKGYRGGIRSECKSCESDRLRLWRAANPEQRKEQWTKSNQRARERRTGAYADTPERKMHSRDRYLRRKYGIGIEDEAAMIERQGGMCACCGQDDQHLVVDHCHDTGVVRDMLCNRCNVALALLWEDPVMIDRLSEYAHTIATDR